MEYKIITGDYGRLVSLFVEEVDRACKNGWTPVGGPCCADGTLYQALIRKND